jgi:hypothetical protein
VQAITRIAVYTLALLFVGVVIGFIDAGFRSSTGRIDYGAAAHFVCIGIVFVHLGRTTEVRPFAVAFAALILSAALASTILTMLGRPPRLDFVFMLNLLPDLLALLIGTYIGVKRRRTSQLRQSVVGPRA